jgi:carbamoylphosphate synthase small subunit
MFLEFIVLILLRNILIFSGLDTRMLTKRIREKGTILGKVCSYELIFIFLGTFCSCSYYLEESFVKQ